MIYFGLIQSMDRFDCKGYQSNIRAKSFLAFPLKFWKKMPKAGAKKGIFCQPEVLVWRFFGVKTQVNR